MFSRLPETKSRRTTAKFNVRIIRSSLSSAEMAPVRISGRRANAFSTRRSKRPIEGSKKIAWFEVFAGETAKNRFDEWLPEDTVTAFKEYLVGIKGPLTTPIGGGIRSLNVALRQLLDLYVCLRPVQYFQGVPSPVRNPEKVDMVIFRENTEDIYAGIEFRAGTPDSQRFLKLFEQEFPKEFGKIRFGTENAAKAFLAGRSGARNSAN